MFANALRVLSQGDTIDTGGTFAAAMKESFHPDAHAHKVDPRGTYQAEIQHYRGHGAAGPESRRATIKVKTAKLLGVSRTTLWRRMKELELFETHVACLEHRCGAKGELS
jgi:transcriptional regulator with PAS, ATPase and Fis domain